MCALRDTLQVRRGATRRNAVPVRVAPLERLVDSDWDITIQRIVPFINGVYHAKRIASEARVHVDLVVRALSILLSVRHCISLLAALACLLT